jgi:glycerophosphoryl diester phosphodiesterase
MKPALRSIGHRGAAGHAPENTLLSIDTALRLGAQAVEIDVQRHPSGELLLLHDLTLERTTSGRGLMSAMSLPALRQLDAGQGQQIPTLEEALDLVEGKAILDLELKSWDGTAHAVARVLREHVAAGWPPELFLVSSFHLPELYEFKQAAPEVPIGVLYCGVPLDWAGLAAELDAVSLNISAEFVDERLIADAHARGLEINVYTVNDPVHIAALAALGVDGIFSDYPERVLAAQPPKAA